MGATGTTPSTAGDVAVGYQALYSNNEVSSTASPNNVAIGYQSLYSLVGNGGGLNVSIGFRAGFGTTGAGNTFVGYNSGYYVSSGYNNTILGANTGISAPISGTGSNYIVLSDGSGVVQAYSDSSGNWTFTGKLLPATDGTLDIGSSSKRWGTVYAVTGTINTSDINEKEQILDLEASEKAVALAIKGLIKKFKWKTSVAEKGANARIHVGVMAQEVRDAFISQGLDPEKYAMFCKDVWWTREEPNLAKDPSNPDHANIPDTNTAYYTEAVEGGVMHERYGVRYDQLFAFMIASL